MPIKMLVVVLLFICFAFDQSYAAQIATAEGIGPVKIGMVVKEAEHALGAKLDPMSEESGEECWVTSRPDEKKPLVRYTVEGRNITEIDVYPPVPETFPLSILAIRTPQGIGVGSTEEEINKAYRSIRPLA
ncbi:MAG: hypothetical protein ACRECP_12750 [Methylocella sp.]